MHVKLDYKIGEKIKALDRVYTCIGFEYIPKRAIRYILMHGSDGTVKWEFLYKYEIEMLKE